MHESKHVIVAQETITLASKILKVNHIAPESGVRCYVKSKNHTYFVQSCQVLRYEAGESCPQRWRKLSATLFGVTYCLWFLVKCITKATS